MGKKNRDDEDYGEAIQYDPDFQGPLAERSCTDVLCLGLFGLFLISWGFVGYFATREGKIDNVYVATDSNHRKCGLDSQVENEPNLLFFDITECVSPALLITGCKTPQVCVEKCPTKNFFYMGISNCSSDNLSQIKEDLICKYGFKKEGINNCDDVDKAITNNDCARWYLASEQYLHRCFPSVKNFKNLPDVFNSSAIKKTLDEFGIFAQFDMYSKNIAQDLKNSWQVIAVSIVISAIACLLLIAIMRFVACPVVWFSIIGLLCLMGYGLYLSYERYIYTKMHPPARTDFDLNLQSILVSRFDYDETWLLILIVLGTIFLVTFTIVLFLRKRISIAIALIKEGSKAVAANITTLIFPIFPWIFQILVIMYSIYVMAMLTSIGTGEYKIADYRADKINGEFNCACNGIGNYSIEAVCTTDDFNQNCAYNGQACSDKACVLVQLKRTQMIELFKGLNVVGFFWLMFFIAAFSEMVLAGVFATWYWTRRTDRPFFSLTESICNVLRFHLGTLAFGSLILTICRIIRLILEYVETKLKKFDNKLVRGILCVCKCCFWCLENFMKFVNKNAYIMTAIHGTSFCASAKNSFNLLMRNILRSFALNRVSSFLFLLSKAFVSLGMAASLYTYLGTEHFQQLGIELHYKSVPCTIVGIVTFMIASVFYDVYSMSIDTLFMCFLEDLERNDGSADRPYQMSKSLRNILNVKNRVNSKEYRQTVTGRPTSYRQSARLSVGERPKSSRLSVGRPNSVRKSGVNQYVDNN